MLFHFCFELNYEVDMLHLFQVTYFQINCLILKPESSTGHISFVTSFYLFMLYFNLMLLAVDHMQEHLELSIFFVR